MSETFGQYLKRRREAAGLTQGELAGRVGMTPTYIGYLERGTDPAGIGEEMRPRLEVVSAIAEALDVPAAEVHCAAGYDPPDDCPASCEAVGSAFDESDFAALHRMYEKLDPARRRAFRPVLDMVRRELELMLREEGAEREGRPRVVRHGLGTPRVTRAAPNRRA